MVNNNYFWNKKIIVSYILAVLVFWVHFTPSLLHYGYDNNLVNLFSSVLGDTLNRVAVPLFFILAGATFYRDYSNDKYLNKLIKRTRSLLIPYLFWNIANMLFEFLTSTFFAQFYTNREKAELTIKNILLGVFYHKYNGPFWFVFALIILTVFAPIIDRILRNKKIAILLILCLIAILPDSFGYARFAIIFYLIGGFVGRFYFDGFTKPVSNKMQVISLLVVVLAFFYFLGVHYEIVTNNHILIVVVLVVSSFSFWNMFDIFLKKDLPSPEFLKHSFLIYAMHINVGAVITKIVYMILPKQTWMCVINFILTTLLTLICIELFCYVINRLSPKTFSVLSGAR